MHRAKFKVWRCLTAFGRRPPRCMLWLVPLALMGPALPACEIPVYQYALNLWPADPYEIVVVHRQEPLARRMVAELQAAAEEQLNLVVRESAPGDVEGPLGEWFEEHEIGDDPWLVVRYPVRRGERHTLWSGALAGSDPLKWLDSPLRQQIVQELQEGSVGVWLLLEGGQRSSDNEAFRLLNSELDRLARVMRLGGGNEGELPTYAPRFARLRLSRNDPAEEALVRMLLASEPDLQERAGEPIVFPIYGRGLVLYALIGAGINEVTITEAAEFLAGDCACEVKSDNPGLELLLQAEWQELLAGGFADFAARDATATRLLEDIRGIAPSVVMPLTESGAVELAETREARARRRRGIAWLLLPLAVTGLLVAWRRGRGRGEV